MKKHYQAIQLAALDHKMCRCSTGYVGAALNVSVHAWNRMYAQAAGSTWSCPKVKEGACLEVRGVWRALHAPLQLQHLQGSRARRRARRPRVGRGHLHARRELSCAARCGAS